MSGRAALAPAPGPPEISPEDRVLLVRTVRGALRDKLAGMPERPARYVPPALKTLKLNLHATLRRAGAAVAEYRTGELPIVEGAVAAGARLGQIVLEKKLRVADRGADWGLELEWFGPRELLAAGNDDQGHWTDELIHAFEPGVEGIGVELRGRVALTRPGEVIALNYTADVAIQAAEHLAEVRQAEKLHAAADLKYFRFRSLHLWQERADIEPIVLLRGTTLIRPDQVNAKELDETIDRIGNYLRYRQNSDGWYSEEYLPTPDKYTLGNSARVQMRALSGLTAYASWRNNKETLDAAAKGWQRSAAFLTPLWLPGDSTATSQSATAVQAGRLLSFPGHQEQLRLSAEMLQGLMFLSERREFDAARTDLAAGLIASMDPKGRFESGFDSSEPKEKDDASGAGAAFAALASYHEWKRDPRIERCIQRGQAYYQDWYRREGTPANSARLAIGLSLAYAATNDARTSDLVFQILDDLSQRQLANDSSVWPDLHGAFSFGDPGVVGADTCVYLAAFAGGTTLANRIGDAARAARFRDITASAARFVMQLEMRPPGAYYVRGPRDALGGIRKSPWNNEIRADLCADAVIGLIAARKALFNDP